MEHRGLFYCPTGQRIGGNESNLELLQRMQLSCHPVALEIKKQLFQGFNSFKQIKHVHGRLFRHGLQQDNRLVNIILRYTLDSGHTDYARLVLRQTKNPNIFLWNTVIRGMVSNDCFHDAMDVYGSMRQMGFPPDNFTFPFVLKACARLNEFKMGLNIHSLVVKVGFDYDVFVKTGLIGLYAKCGYLNDAQKVFDDIQDKNVVSWTAIICGYIEFRHYKEAIDLFRALSGTGLRPDGITLVRVLWACTQLADLNSGEWIDRYITENRMHKNVFVSTSLVDMYAKCGKMEKARNVFNDMREKDIVAWSSMIQGYASNGFPKEAIDIFLQMQREHIKPDCYAMVGALSACGRLGAIELGNWASCLMNEDEFLSNPVLGTALIDMHAKCGSMVKAWDIFKRMKSKDCVVFNAVISGLAMNGHSKVAFGVFGQVEKYGIRPDCNTFMGLLCGCTHAGLVDDGRRYFDSMSLNFSINPTVEHYGCMVDLFSRAGLLTEAYQLIKRMPMEANTVVWGSLLAGCRLHRDTQLAEHALKQLISLEPWNSGNYVLLANIYSAGRRWDEAEKIRSSMDAKGVQKVPGWSWIEVKGVIHEFLVGDKSHPVSEKIYEKLDEVAKNLKAAGYVPTTEYVLFDIEEEEKEHFLGCHSEKLAVAFGLITIPPEDVIRVVKNLRVCGDCHAVMKLMSKVTGREIVIRDNNRYHLFAEGSCSCKDYW